MAVAICIPTNSVEGFLLPHIVLSTCYLEFLTVVILVGVRWHIVADLVYVSLVISDVAFLHEPLGLLQVFFVEMSVQGLCPSQNVLTVMVQTFGLQRDVSVQLCVS